MTGIKRSLNIIIKNQTVISISVLYMAKFSSDKIAKNLLLGLICMKNELVHKNPSIDSFVMKGKLHDDVWFC